MTDVLVKKSKMGTLKANRAKRRAIVERLDVQVKYTERDRQLGLELKTMLTLRTPDFVTLDDHVALLPSSS